MNIVQGMKKPALILCITGLFFSTFSFAQSSLWEGVQQRENQSRQIEGLIPNGKNFKPAVLGFDNLMADVYWVKMIQYLGGNVFSEDRKFFYAYLDLITDLDPHFTAAYQRGILLLPDEGKFEETEKLIEKGLKKNPNDWRISYAAGYYYYFYAEDFEKALELYEHCERLEGCIKGATRMRKNIKTSIGKYEVAVQERVQDLLDPEISDEEIELSQKKIQEAASLLFLNDAAQQYFLQNQKNIETLEDLQGFVFVPKNQKFFEYIRKNQNIFDFKIAVQKDENTDTHLLEIDDAILVSPYKWNGYKWSDEEQRVRTERF